VSTATLELLSVELPPIDQDGVLVSTITITEDQARHSRVRAIFNGGRGVIDPGEYTALFVDDVLWMSDTPDEKYDHYDPVAVAVRHGGRVLINGLGLGMVVGAMLKIPHVEHVDVVEHDKRIIDAIGPHYAGERCTIHHADAYTITWPVGSHWSVVWHDIWPSIGSDNLPEMGKLHRKYGRRADWQGSWARDLCERARKEGW
jgi:hypothetical protein